MWVVLLVVGIAAVAPEVSGAPSLSVEPRSATVGDFIKMSITCPNTDPDNILWPEYDEKMIGELHLVNADTILSGREMKKLGGPTLILTLAAYETGNFSTDSLTMSVAGELFSIPPQTVTINSVLDDSTGTQLAPLKAQEDLPFTMNDFARLFGPWIVGAGVLMILWSILRRLIRRLRKVKSEEEEEIPLLSPYDEAMEALHLLEQENPLAKGDQKGYVTALAQISKKLLERTHLSPVLEMTTWEVKRWLGIKPTLCEPDDLLKILDAGDSVKFAKGSLDPSSADILLSATKRIVKAYEPRPETVGGNGNGEDSALAPETSEQVAEVSEMESDSPKASWKMHTAQTGANKGARK